jgi:hypothetical protein
MVKIRVISSDYKIKKRYEQTSVVFKFVLARQMFKFICIGTLSAGVPVYICIRRNGCKHNVVESFYFYHLDDLKIFIPHAFFILHLNIYLTVAIVKFLNPRVSEDFPVNYINGPLSMKYLRLNCRQHGQY